MDMKQTAVEWLMEQWEENPSSLWYTDFDKAKAMEKEQMFEFWKGGQNSMEEHGKSFHQYHNNTYKQQDK